MYYEYYYYSFFQASTRERERIVEKLFGYRQWQTLSMVSHGVCVCVVCIRRQHCDRQTLQCIRADWRLPNAKTMCGPRRQSYNWSKTLASSVMCWLWRGYICSMGPQIVWRLGVWHIAHHHQSSHLYLFSDNSAASINSRRNRKKKNGIVKVKKISLCVVLLFYLNMVVWSSWRFSVWVLDVWCAVLGLQRRTAPNERTTIEPLRRSATRVAFNKIHLKLIWMTNLKCRQ